MIKVDGQVIELKKFRSGELDVTIPREILDNPEKRFNHVVTWYYENDGELFALFCIARTLNHIHILNIPYLPNARMDRIDRVDHNVFTLKYFAEFIRYMGAEIVNVFDIHSKDSLTMFNHINNIAPDTKILEALRKIQDQYGEENVYILLPDKGAVKRYSKCFENVNFKKVLTGIKDRTWKDGKITSFEIVLPEGVSIKDKAILIVDDISSSGETFRLAAEALKEKGAGDVYLYASYVERATLNNTALLNTIKKIYTPTFFTYEIDKEKIECLELDFDK